MGLISPTCLQAAFMRAHLKIEKRQSSQQCIFVLLESSLIKAAHKMLVKSTPAQLSKLTDPYKRHKNCFKANFCWFKI